MSAVEEVEYERTFLVTKLPDGLSDLEGTEMIDAYVPNDASVHPRVRLRKSGKRHQLTKKLPLSEGDASAHSEQTIPLTAEEFECLATCSKRRIEKVRYKLQIAGKTAELDVFKGALAGLALIDFEFSSKEELEAFSPPDICGADVTQENFIAGGLLAGKTYDDISSELSRFGYDKV